MMYRIARWMDSWSDGQKVWFLFIGSWSMFSSITVAFFGAGWLPRVWNALCSP